MTACISRGEIIFSMATDLMISSHSAGGEFLRESSLIPSGRRNAADWNSSGADSSSFGVAAEGKFDKTTAESDVADPT